ncbi:MAG: hypothetical protein B6U94_05130 [Thermofilum sp. ex4484_79]|nr:MAG: hypothetical protein B6U94_05130 [Thermofilum sp. ex4484_79]
MYLRKSQSCIVLCILILSLSTLPYIPKSSSQTLKYRVLREYVTLAIEKDSTVTLVYNLTVIVDEGAIRRFVSIGMPNKYFKVLEVREIDTGKKISFSEYKDGEYYVKAYVSTPIEKGQTRTFYLVAVIEKLLFKDKTNPGNSGLQFIPSWFPVRVEDLKLTIILPEGVGKNEVKNTPDYDNIFTIDDRIALYWERKGLSPDEKFKVGISFPEKYLSVSLSEPSSGEEEEEDWLFWVIFFAVILLVFGLPVIAILFVFIKGTRALEYVKPELYIEALGPRKGLYAPEAAWIIESEKAKPNYSKILTMILYSLIRKNAVQILSIDPLRLEENEDFQGRLRYYERAFLKCVNGNGRLNEDCLIKVIDKLDKGVASKIRGYSRKETVEYYKKIVKRAWDEVQRAQTPLLKLEKAQENMDWLLLDPEYHRKIRIYLSDPTPVDIQYAPTWTRTLPLSSRRTYAQNPPNLVQLADTVATNLEKVSQRIVENVESFAEKVARTIEGRTSKGTESRSRPIFSSSCACVSCACACACVSCACACASGGAG